MGYTGYNTAKQLQRHGILKKVLCFSHASSDINEDKVIDVIRLPALVEKPCFSLQRMSLPGYAIKDTLYDFFASKKLSKCDIFHSWANQSLLCVREGKRLGIKTILERPSAHIDTQNEILQEEYTRLGIRRKPIHGSEIRRNNEEYDKCDRILVPSTFAYESFLKKGFAKEKLILLHYGVDLNRFQASPKKDKIFRCLFAGQVTLNKGVHYLLKAWAELKLKDAELIIAGPVIFSEMRKILGGYARSDNSIKQLNFVKNMEGLYRQSSIFVLPSLVDGFGLVVTEAMACGLPVIVSENTGAKDFVKDGYNGFVVPIRDSNALKEKILYFYENREAIEEMDRNARQTALSWTWDDYGKALVAKYKEVL